MNAEKVTLPDILLTTWTELEVKIANGTASKFEQKVFECVRFFRENISENEETCEQIYDDLIRKDAIEFFKSLVGMNNKGA